MIIPSNFSTLEEMIKFTRNIELVQVERVTDVVLASLRLSDEDLKKHIKGYLILALAEFIAKANIGEFSQQPVEYENDTVDFIFRTCVLTREELVSLLKQSYKLGTQEGLVKLENIKQELRM